MSENALEVRRVSKAFKLPHEKVTSLKSLIINPFRHSKTYERQKVLNNLSFEVKKGEFFGIVGRNGSGKSTLLKLLASIYVPDNGTVHVNGKLVPFIELGVGFNPELTGRDNVFLNGALLGFSDKEVRAIYDDIVEFAELKDFMDQKLKNYSSGMQVRLAFSVATRVSADILLVDEVLAVGDVSFQRKCYDYFSSLKRSGKTVIFISHDMDAVRQYCDRAMLVNEGEIVAIGSADKMAEAYTKLFSQSGNGSNGEDSTAKRWGDGSIEVVKPSIDVKKDTLKIEMLVTAKKPVNDLVVGISIKGNDGKIISGTNTQLLDKRIPPMNAGEELKLTWKVPNILADGAYVIDIASHGYGGLPVYDWWNDAISLNSQFGRKSPYSVAPEIDLKISS